MKVQQKTTETKSTPKLAFFPFFPRKLCHETINPWCSQRALTRGMDSTWELVNGAGSRHTPSQIYWIRTSILTKSRAEPNTHQGMRNTALEEFWWSCSRWGDDKESSPFSRTQVFRLWTTWMPIIRGVCFKKKCIFLGSHSRLWIRTTNTHAVLQFTIVSALPYSFTCTPTSGPLWAPSDPLLNSPTHWNNITKRNFQEPYHSFVYAPYWMGAGALFWNSYEWYTSLNK